MRAVWAHRRLIAAYRPSRVSIARWVSDDLGVSFTTCGSRYFGNLAHDVETDHGNLRVFVTDVRRFDVKDMCTAHFMKGSRIGVRD